MMTARRLFAGSLLVCLCLLPLGAIADESPVSYDNHKWIRAYPASWEEIEQIHDAGGLLLSCVERIGETDYVIPPEALTTLVGQGIPFEVLDEDVQQWIDGERQRLALRDDVNPRADDWFYDYKDYAAINAKLNALATDRPDLATVFSIGTTLEGRQMWAIRITGPGTGKPAVLFNGAQHAREWIAPMVNMYIADHLISEYDTNPTVQHLVNSLEFIIVPVVNPDGYVYTWTTNRLWRKNRRDNSGTSCDGVDLNRNWGGTGYGGSGSSSDPCDETYRGIAAFSEPETLALRNFIQANPQIAANIDFHSYGQYILSPWGYTYALPADNDTFLAIGAAMRSEILAVHGKAYTYGPISSTLYVASGGSVDWCYEDEGIFSYTIELRDQGNYGFELPPAEILPCTEEVWPAAMYFAEWAITPLHIEFPEGLPLSLGPDTTTPVRVKFTETWDALDQASPRLFTRRNGAATFEEFTLLALGNNEFEATLPAIPCGQSLEYYFAANSDGGFVRMAPEDAPAEVYSATASGFSLVFEDTMETDLGWTVGAADDDATSGIWNRMNPQGTDNGGAVQPEDDHTGTGTICWVTDGNAGTSAGSYDVDGGKTTLLSPAFDATGGVMRVSYWRWYSNDKGGDPNADVFTIDISGNGGQSWANVETVGPGGAEASGGWYYHEFVVQDVTTPTASMQMRFVAADEGSGSLVEAAVDDFQVWTEEPCPNPIGDLNCDGVVDLFDVDPFVLALTSAAHPVPFDDYYAAYSACNAMLADADENGEVDLFDVDAFVALLTGG